MERKSTSGNRSSKLEGHDESENIFSDVAPAMSSPTYDVSQDLLKTSDMGSTSVTDEISSLKSDLQSIKQSLASLTSKASSSAMGMASDATSKMSETVSGVASTIAEKSTDIASAASRGASSLTAEVEDITRRNPLPALAGAVAVGMLVGMAARGRN